MNLIKKNVKWAFIAAGAASLLLSPSCIKEDFSKIKSGPWEPEFAFPLVKTSLSIESLLNDSLADSFLDIDENNLPWIVYSTELFSFQAAEILDIPDTTVSTEIDLSDFTVTPPPDGVTIFIGEPDPLLQEVDFNAGADVELDSIKFKSGDLQLSVVSELTHDFTIYFEIPTARNEQGEIFSDSIQVPNSGTSGGTTYFLDIDLAGYTFDLTKGGTTFNKFDVEVGVKITKGPDPVNGDEVTTITESFSNLAFDALYGYIGQQTIPALQDSLNFPIFSATDIQGDFTIEDPQVNLVLSNSYGVPVQMDFIEFSAFRWEQGPDGQTSLLTDKTDSVYIDGPGFDRIGDTVNTVAVFDKTNMDIDALLAEAPEYLIYNLEGVTNPLGKIGDNFVLDTSKIDIDMEIRVPIYGAASGFTMTDTMALDLASVDEIDHLGLLFNITNGFPIEIGIQLYFVDTNDYVIKDSLYPDGPAMLESAIADPTTGDVTADTDSRIEAFADSELMDVIAESNGIIVVASIATYNDGQTSVKLYTDYEIAVKVGGLVGLSSEFPPDLDSLDFGGDGNQ